MWADRLEGLLAREGMRFATLSRAELAAIVKLVRAAAETHREALDLEAARPYCEGCSEDWPCPEAAALAEIEKGDMDVRS